MAELKLNNVSALTESGGTISLTNLSNVTASGNITITGDLIPSTPMSHRNMIINGGMQVAQRATSSTAGSGYTNLDRFRWTGAGHATMAGTIAQTAVTDLAGFSKCLKYTITEPEVSIGSTEYWWMHQKIEAQDLQHLNYGTANAKICTLSFYVRCSIAGTYAVSILKPDSTNQMFGGTYTVSSDQASNSTSASGWQRVSIVIPANTAQGIDDNNGIGLEIHWVLFAGSNYTATDNTSWANTVTGHYAYGHSTTMGTVDNSTWEITGVQLELGSSATPFEHRSFGDELARCQRYFQAFSVAGGGVWNSTTRFLCAVAFSVPMRSAPSITTKSGVLSNINIEHDDTYNVSNLNSGTYHAQFEPAGAVSHIALNMDVSSSSGRTQGYGGLAATDTASDLFYFNSEL